MVAKAVLLLFLMGIILVFGISAMEQKKKPGPMQPFPTEICEIKKRSDLEKRCVGKRVRLSGTKPKVILQHPNLTYPDLSSTGGYIHQNYIDTEWGQVVLISKEPIACEGDFEVEGILRFASLGGKVGKESYKNPYIQVLSFKCK